MQCLQIRMIFVFAIRGEQRTYTMFASAFAHVFSQIRDFVIQCQGKLQYFPLFVSRWCCLVVPGDVAAAEFSFSVTQNYRTQLMRMQLPASMCRTYTYFIIAIIWMGHQRHTKLLTA